MSITRTTILLHPLHYYALNRILKKSYSKAEQWKEIEIRILCFHSTKMVSEFIARPQGDILCLFDVDGTLSLARQVSFSNHVMIEFRITF